MILGPDDRLEIEALRSVESPHTQLVVLSVGYPPTLTQRAGVDTALRLAAERRFVFGALLVWSMDEALDFLNPGDEVLTAVSERAPLAAAAR